MLVRDQPSRAQPNASVSSSSTLRRPQPDHAAVARGAAGASDGGNGNGGNGGSGGGAAATVFKMLRRGVKGRVEARELMVPADTALAAAERSRQAHAEEAKSEHAAIKAMRAQCSVGAIIALVCGSPAWHTLFGRIYLASSFVVARVSSPLSVTTTPIVLTSVSRPHAAVEARVLQYAATNV